MCITGFLKPRVYDSCWWNMLRKQTVCLYFSTMPELIYLGLFFFFLMRQGLVL